MRQAVFLQRVAQPQIAFEVTAPTEPVHFECDGRLVSQALTNVLKNAGEAIAARMTAGDDDAGPHRHRRARSRTTASSIASRDNGIGLPPEHRHRLTEPYVTTRAKGTGLGPRDRAQDPGRPWRRAVARGCRRRSVGEIAGAVVRMQFPLRQSGAKTNRS